MWRDKLTTCTNTEHYHCLTTVVASPLPPGTAASAAPTSACRRNSAAMGESRKLRAQGGESACRTKAKRTRRRAACALGSTALALRRRSRATHPRPQAPLVVVCLLLNALGRVFATSFEAGVEGVARSVAQLAATRARQWLRRHVRAAPHAVRGQGPGTPKPRIRHKTDATTCAQRGVTSAARPAGRCK